MEGTLQSTVWQDLRTDFTPKDYFNVEDWNYIVGNLRWLKSFCTAGHDDSPLHKQREDIPTLADLNSLAADITRAKKDLFGDKLLHGFTAPKSDYSGIGAEFGAVKLNEICKSLTALHDGVLCFKLCGTAMAGNRIGIIVK